jgi:hypothetical protein
MPPKGYSWREERDWDVHNAEGWLGTGLPSELSSETLNGRKASKKSRARTMQLKARNFVATPCILPAEAAARLQPLQASLSEIRHLVGVQSEPFAEVWDMPSDDEDTPQREVMLSSFSLQARNKLNVVFLRNRIGWMTSDGAVCNQSSVPLCPNARHM